MSRTSIEWTHIPGTIGEVWNIVTGCNKVSRGCKHCYAEVMHKRLMKMQPKKYNRPFLEGAVTHPDLLNLPLTWKKPRTVFVNSMSDLFHEDIPFEFIRLALLVMYQCRDLHTFIILTKRVERVLEFDRWMVDNINAFWFGFDKNVWLVASVEDQEQIERIPLLLKVTAKVRGLSCEPLLGNLNISPYLKVIQEDDRFGYGGPFGGRNKIDWVIAGGESGRKARPMHPDWVRSLRDQCAEADIPFFFKQWGEYYTRWQHFGNHKPVFKMYKSYLQFTQKLWVHKGDKCVDAAGKECSIGKDFMNATYPVAIMTKVGKHNSGHMLDGKEHLAFPKVLNAINEAL